MLILNARDFACVTATVERSPSGKYWILRLICPLCGKRHAHGGGSTEFLPEGGHRAAHCLKHGRTYMILIPKPPYPSAPPAKTLPHLKGKAQSKAVHTKKGIVQ